MGRRIVHPSVQAQKRSEDFMKMDSWHYLATENGLRIMCYVEVKDGAYVEYLKPDMQREPVLVECRDAQDYDLRVAAWIKACTVRSRHYPSFQDMVLGEIERLKKKL